MGVFLALFGAAAFSVMNVAIRKGVRPGDRDNGVLTSVVVNVGIFTVLLVIVAVVAGLPPVSPEGIVAFSGAGLASTFIGRSMLFAGIRRAGAVRAAAVKNATPLVTLFIALTVLGERLAPGAVVGIVLVMLGVALVVRESMERSAREDLGTDRHDPASIGLEAEALAEVGAVDGPAMPLRGVPRLPRGAQRAMLIGLGLAGLGAISFGTGHALRKVGMDLVPDALVGATIGSWAALVAYGLAATVRGQLGAFRRSVTARRPWFLVAGVGGAAGQIAFFAALLFSPVAHVSVVAASETILTVAFAALMTQGAERITRQLVIPATLVFVGVSAIALAR